MAGRRRAITIGVSDFAGHHNLPFAVEVVPELASALDALGFETTAVTAVDTAELGRTVAEAIAGLDHDDTLLVHVVSHGHTDLDAQSSPVYVLGSSGTPEPGTDVELWLRSVQFVDDGPLTLFLLDLCFSGRLARLPWQSEVDDRKARAWVIAASSGSQAAYDGRFTKATINVLRALAAGELDVNPADEHIPLFTVARHIHQDVNRLAAVDGGYDQRVTASLVDMSADPRPPFFPNPAYTVGGRVQLRAHLDPGLLPFLDDLDEGLDARHFLERAAGIGRLAEQTGLVGCFSGRKRELRDLSLWLNGDASGELRVVTGSPGVGKSALLGVLVCAAHPTLRDATRPIWHDVAHSPARLSSLVAVHARRRGLGSITESIARQLDLSAEDLVSQVPAGTVIVLDALDEADGAESIMRSLLLPLADKPGVRLLVGVRNYEEFAPLLAADGLVDLDGVAPDVLRADLYRYVDDLLQAVPAYRDRGEGVSAAFAHAIASVLSTEDDGPRHWGPFLVAGLYTRQLITQYPDAGALDSTAAAQFGKQIPKDLPAVLDLDLSSGANPWLRPALTALAHAKGQGMPSSVLTRVASVFGPGTATMTDIRSALNDARFYLRQATDTDRTTAHRLFHQGLVVHLATADHADPLLDALLAPLGPAAHRDWAAAEPYLFRHVLDHAEAAGRTSELADDLSFLLHPATVITEASRTTSAIWSLMDDLRQTTSGRPTVALLAMAAARRGEPDLARRIANAASGAPITWQPRWVRREPHDDPPTVRRLVVTELLGKSRDRRTIAMSADGSRLAAASFGKAMVWNGDGKLLHALKTANKSTIAMSRNGRILVIATAFGTDVLDVDSGQTLWGSPRSFYTEPTAVAVNDSGSRVIRLEHGQVHQLWPDGEATMATIDVDKPVAAVAFDDVGVPTVAWADQENAVKVLHRGATREVNVPGGRPSAIACARNSPILGWCTENGVRMSDWKTPGQGTLLSDAHAGSVAISGKGDLVAVGHVSGRVTLHRPGSSETIAEHHKHQAPVVAVTMDDAGKTVLSTDSLGRVLLWRTAEEQSAPPPAGITTVAVPPEGEPDIAVVGDTSGVAQAVDLATGESLGPACSSDGPVGWINFHRLFGRHVVRIIWPDDMRLFDPVRGHEYLDGQLPWLKVTEHEVRLRRCIFVADHLDDNLVEVIGDDTGTVTVRDVVTARPIRHFEHSEPVTAVVCRELAGRPVAFSGSLDGTVKVWDLTRLDLTDTVEIGCPVQDLDVTSTGHLLVVAGGELIAFQHISAVR